MEKNKTLASSSLPRYETRFRKRRILRKLVLASRLQYLVVRVCLCKYINGLKDFDIVKILLNVASETI